MCPEVCTYATARICRCSAEAIICLVDHQCRVIEDTDLIALKFHFQRVPVCSDTGQSDFMHGNPAPRIPTEKFHQLQNRGAAGRILWINPRGVMRTIRDIHPATQPSTKRSRRHADLSLYSIVRPRIANVSVTIDKLQARSLQKSIGDGPSSVPRWNLPRRKR